MRAPMKIACQAVIGWMALANVVTGAPVSARSGITIDDLVRRVDIPLAAISPDGRYAAYVLLRGDPVADAYDLTVRVSDLNAAAAPTTLTTYQLPPEDAKDEADNIQPHAADVRWVAQGMLLYLERAEGKMRLRSWSARDGNTRVVIAAHDRIAIDASSQANAPLTITTRDFISRPASPPDTIADNALVMRDGLRHYDVLRNPTVGRWFRQQTWAVTLEPAPSVDEMGPATESPETSLEDWAEAPVDLLLENTPDTSIYVYDQIRAPDGVLTAAVEESSLNLTRPGESYPAARVVVLQASKRRGLTPLLRPNPRFWILGWSPDGKNVVYVNNDQRGTTLNRVTLTGKASVIYREYGDLRKPCLFGTKSCQVLSQDGRFALLLRSNNTLPTELVRIDTQRGSATVVDSPNAIFTTAPHPAVRLLPIEMRGAETAGRLYLPLDYRPGARYPLVITQYVSTPGYYAATGDEVPIQALAANGIAVYAMEARGFNDVSNSGDFRMEISRVQRPLEGVEWLCRKLDGEGLIDPTRIGLTGLSYGAEISMYAYWRSRLFRTVSVATASWDPVLTAFAGNAYGKFLEVRGFPLDFDEAAIRQWKQLSAGLNASPSLPPLLIQGPDGEQYFTAPTWLRLRRANAPVEWLQYPSEGHEKRSPANRWWVYTRNLDWFRFWLKDEEDGDPAKAEQYRRWRQLRDTHSASLTRRGCSTGNSTP